MEGSKAAGRLANAAPLLGWRPATPAAVAASTAQRLPAAAATRGSARSSAAAAPLPNLCASSSGVLPACSRGEGRGAGRRAPEPPLRAPHPVLCQRVHPRGREEEGDDGGVAFRSRLMQRGVAILQGRGWRRREEGGGEVRGGRRGAGNAARGEAGKAAGERRGPQRGTLTPWGADAAFLDRSQSEGTFAHRIAHQKVVLDLRRIRPRRARMRAGGEFLESCNTHTPERPLDKKACHAPLASPAPLGRDSGEPVSSLLFSSHLVCCGRVGACR